MESCAPCWPITPELIEREHERLWHHTENKTKRGTYKAPSISPKPLQKGGLVQCQCGVDRIRS
jgi:hypothetical protein